MNESSATDCLVSKVNIEGIPIILIKNLITEVKPIVFIFHKLLMRKEDQLPLAYNLASRGFFCVLMDMHGHGEREISFDKTMKYEFNELFADIYKTAANIHPVIAFLKANYAGKLDFDNMNCVGASIGGSIAAVTGYLRDDIKNIVFMVAIPCNWENSMNADSFRTFKFFSKSKQIIDYERMKSDMQKYEPLKYYHQGNFSHKSMFFLNGQLDTAMPVETAYQSYQKLKNILGPHHNIRFKKYPRVGHEVSNGMLIDLFDWLKEKNERWIEGGQ